MALLPSGRLQSARPFCLLSSLFSLLSSLLSLLSSLFSLLSSLFSLLLAVVVLRDLDPFASLIARRTHSRITAAVAGTDSG